MSQSGVVRVFVVDDQPIVREGICAVLTDAPGVSVVGTSGDGNDAIEQCANLKPHAVLIDLSLSGLPANAVTRQLTEMDVRVVALIDTPDAASMNAIVEAGALGLLLKSDELTAYPDAVAHVMADDKNVYQSERVKRVFALGDPDAKVIDSAVRPLTPRELEVLKMFADGNSTSEIATRLGLSVKTVETHRKNVMDKLQTRSIAQLTKIAIQAGISSI